MIFSACKSSWLGHLSILQNPKSVWKSSCEPSDNSNHAVSNGRTNPPVAQRLFLQQHPTRFSSRTPRPSHATLPDPRMAQQTGLESLLKQLWGWIYPEHYQGHHNFHRNGNHFDRGDYHTLQRPEKFNPTKVF